VRGRTHQESADRGPQYARQEKVHADCPDQYPGSRPSSFSNRLIGIGREGCSPSVGSQGIRVQMQSFSAQIYATSFSSARRGDHFSRRNAEKPRRGRTRFPLR
jgi:hypothetical protein